MVSTLIAAKDYAARGLPITVCRDKHPLGIGWTPTEAGEKWQDKIWDGAELDTAWETCGALNLGIMLGPKAGFIDMEADGDEEEESFRKLFDGVEIPKTPMFKSRRSLERPSLTSRDWVSASVPTARPHIVACRQASTVTERPENGLFHWMIAPRRVSPISCFAGS